MSFELGENGESVYTTMEEKEAADRSIQEYGFNMVASDKIAMDRTIPDTRMDEWVSSDVTKFLGNSFETLSKSCQFRKTIFFYLAL